MAAAAPAVQGLCVRARLLLCALVLGMAGAAQAQVIVHQQDFAAGLGGWQAVDVLDATNTWTVAGGVAQIYGFGGGNDQDWLISPPIDLNAQGSEYLLFDYLDDFPGALLHLFYSTTYSGAGTAAAVGAATWTELPLELVDFDATVCQGALLQRHPALDISGIAGSAVRFAFRYTGQSTIAKAYQVDNVRILSGYYDPIETAIANGTDCAELKTLLRALVARQSDRIRYTSTLYDVWDAFLHTDDRINDAGTARIVWDMFTDRPTNTGEFEYDHCADRDNGTCAGGEGACYNREHTLPVSWWGGGTALSDTQYVDLHHLVSSDKALNALKNNYPPGLVPAPSSIGSNGFKFGANNSYPCGTSMRYYEPIDAYKGDYARMFLYLATRYENLIAGWAPLTTIGDCALSGDPYTAYEPWLLSLLSQWHLTDPVSQKEVDHNNAVYAIQGNRNPFIDHPEYAGLIWTDFLGNPCNTVVLPIDLISFDAQRTADGVQLDWATASERDNAYFRVDRSPDMQSWEPVAQVPGAGQANSLHTYRSLDARPPNSTTYYRLAQVDFDGSTRYAQVRVVPERAAAGTLSAYPSPTTGLVTVTWSAADMDLAALEVYGADGRLLTPQVTVSRVGAQSAQLDLGRLSPGMYLLRAGAASVRVQKG